MCIIIFNMFYTSINLYTLSGSDGNPYRDGERPRPLALQRWPEAHTDAPPAIHGGSLADNSDDY